MFDLAELERAHGIVGQAVPPTPAHAWPLLSQRLGTHVVVTDGSTIGRDAIIGAGAVVVGEVPEFSIATGIPAKVTRNRKDS